MDPRAAATASIRQAIAEPEGLKALLLDSETSRIISLLHSQSDLLKQEVMLIERLTSKRTTRLSHLHAVVFVRPTAANIHALRMELGDPHYDSYKLVFSNIVRRTFIEEVADADQDGRVSEVREVYSDFFALDNRLLSIEVCPCLEITPARTASVHNPSLDRTVEGITAALLALKRRPQVRYQAASSLCRNLAERLCVKMDQEHNLFDFRQRGTAPPLLLLLDRREDPVTPLLNQWTYEAMVHELIGIRCNRVSLGNAPNIPDEFRELVLDDLEDEFYRENRYRNFGDLGMNLKNLVDSFQRQSKSGADLKTIEDMMRFVGNYPEFRKSSSNVSKHVALAGELSRLVGQMNLLEVSQLEQDLACREAESEHRHEILELLKRPNVTDSDKVRLVMLYSLRYEETNNKGLPLLKDALHKAGISPEGIHLITAVKEYAGAAKRTADVFSNRSFFAMASNKVRRGIGGVDNVYTQHEPHLIYILDDLLRDKLRHADFPLAQAEESVHRNKVMEDVDPTSCISAPREIFVAIAGGATYEESKCLSAINGGPNSFTPPEGSTTASVASAARQAMTQVVLLGTCIHNSTTFATEITCNANAQRQSNFLRPQR